MKAPVDRFIPAVAALSIVGCTLWASTGSAEYAPTDAERARWTMSDMRSLATAIEAYAGGHQGYPPSATFAEVVVLVQPNYMKKAPAHDAWGHAFVYVVGPDRQSYRLVSAGSDGKTDPSSWGTAGVLSSFEEDAVLDSGSVVRPWPFR
jgi:hypothetical protein